MCVLAKVISVLYVCVEGGLLWCEQVLWPAAVGTYMLSTPSLSTSPFLSLSPSTAPNACHPPCPPHDTQGGRHP